MRERRKFLPDQKKMIVEAIILKGKSVSSLCELFDLDRQTVHRWVNEYKAHGESAFGDRAILPGDDYVAIKKRELRDLQEENNILKKISKLLNEPDSSIFRGSPSR